MLTVKDLLGPHAYWFQRYGVGPEESVESAASKLMGAAPHLAELLRRIAAERQLVAGGR